MSFSPISPRNYESDVNNTQRGYLELRIGGQNFRVKKLDTKQNPLLSNVQLKKLESFFDKVFDPHHIDLSKVELSRLQVSVTSKGDFKIISSQKDKITHLLKEKEFIIPKNKVDIDGLLNIPTLPEDVEVPGEVLIQVRKEPSLIRKIIDEFKKLFASLFGTNSSTSKAITTEIRKFLEKCPLKVQEGIYSQLSSITKQEEAFAASLREQFTLPEGMDEREFVAQVLNGAYVMIDDNGDTKKKWIETMNPIERSSSHESDGPQYAFRGPIVKECLFSTKKVKGADGKEKTVTWFQLERYPHDGGINTLLHGWTYVLYKAHDQNQGPYGESPHREGSQPLTVKLKARV